MLNTQVVKIGIIHNSHSKDVQSESMTTNCLVGLYTKIQQSLFC